MTTLPDLRDLDRYRDETNDRRLALTVGGHTYEFSAASLPYRAGLLIKRMQVGVAQFAERVARGEQPDPTERLLSPAEEVYLFDTVIPPEMRARWETDDITVAETEHIRETVVRWLAWGIDNATAYWEGRHLAEDARPPEGPASTKTGGSSKRATPRKRRSTGATSSVRGRTSKPGSTPTTG